MIFTCVHVAGMIRTSGAVDVSSQVMQEMSELVKVPELKKSIGKMSKELIKASEIIEDFFSPCVPTLMFGSSVHVVRHLR